MEGSPTNNNDVNVQRYEMTIWQRLIKGKRAHRPTNLLAAVTPAARKCPCNAITSHNFDAKHYNNPAVKMLRPSSPASLPLPLSRSTILCVDMIIPALMPLAGRPSGI